MPLFHEISINGLQGQPDLLADSAGKVVLAVNVASECGLTPQYAGLEQLYKNHADDGLTIVGFPCNQFGAQEPGSEEQIQSFCTSNYGVTFPLAAKIDVNGDGRHPLYAWLTDQGNGFPGDIEWNFEKFLIGRNGKIIARYPPATKPEDAGLLQDIADAL